MAIVSCVSEWLLELRDSEDDITTSGYALGENSRALGEKGC
jgi:hypothetical protein